MSLVDEYRKQHAWRHWEQALSSCPWVPGQAVLDLGCGTGEVSGLLAARGLKVTGVDGDRQLLAAASERHPGCSFERQDLMRLSMPPATFDGLWCSFTAAYFADFARVWDLWIACLKPSAWVCVIDIDDLLGHEPLPAETRSRIEAFYAGSLAHGRYDFRAGRRLSAAIAASGFEVRELELPDQELAFSGPAVPEVLEAWRQRFIRMKRLDRFLGGGSPAFRSEFLECLASPEHRSRCRVLGCVGTRTGRPDQGGSDRLQGREQ